MIIQAISYVFHFPEPMFSFLHIKEIKEKYTTKQTYGIFLVNY